MKSLGVPVVCSACGKHLRGIATIPSGYKVRRHARPGAIGGDAPCPGSRKYDHVPLAVPREEVR